MSAPLLEVSVSWAIDGMPTRSGLNLRLEMTLLPLVRVPTNGICSGVR